VALMRGSSEPTRWADRQSSWQRVGVDHYLWRVDECKSRRSKQTFLLLRKSMAYNEDLRITLL
jgi:hypothetical protein